ncbi:septum formation initiator family protein [Candidatus Curtissbacteria bacterium]|nr:septum formation initiator family protein [Candidatus Curtissbacteria bacterium]
MKRNLILIAAILVSILLAVNSARRIMTFRTTAAKVTEAQRQLDEIRRENEALARELEYKKSDEFAEAEIRNKLGLAKPGETVVVLPKDDERRTTNDERKIESPNWQKWWNLFFKG